MAHVENNSEPVLFSRPQVLNQKIHALLHGGTVADLRSTEGQFLSECFTPGEACAALDLPMPECPGFNGVDCDFCRGYFRFSQCQQCHGAFDPMRHGWPGEPSSAHLAFELPAAIQENKAQAAALAKSVQGGKVRQFFARLGAAWDALKGDDASR